MTRTPNLFIVGAPRCGTTSLHNYVAQHQECYMSTVKEPGYFSRHRVREDLRAANPAIWTYERYLAHFADARPTHRIVGESSVSYLRDEAALAELRETVDDPRIIAMVRDPVVLVSSYFHHLRFSGLEPVRTFQEAWDLQDERCAGRIDSRSACRPDALAYRDLAMLGKQVERLFRLFPRERVLVLVSDDLRLCPETLGRQVQDFLGVQYDPHLLFSRDNSARVPRLRIISDPVKRPPPWLARARDSLKRALGVRSLGIRALVDTVNVRQESYLIDPGLVPELRRCFRSDVELLSELLGQDLIDRWWT